MSYKALLISDEQEHIQNLILAFRKEQFQMVTVHTAEDARLVLAREAIGTIVVDENVRDARGIDLMVEFAHDFQNVPRVFVASQVDLEAAVRLVNQAQAFRVLRKPWDTDTLAVAIRTALRKYTMKTLSDRVVNLARRQIMLVEELDRESTAGGEVLVGGVVHTQEMPASARVVPQTAQALEEIDPIAMLQPLEAASLSRREKEILRAVVAGKKPRDLARMFFISVHTARNHIKAIYRKLGVHAQGELIAKVLRAPGRERYGNATA